MQRNFKAAAKKRKSANRGFSDSFYGPPKGDTEADGDEEQGGGNNGGGGVNTGDVELTESGGPRPSSKRNSRERPLPQTPQEGTRTPTNGSPRNAGRGGQRVSAQYQQVPQDGGMTLSMDPAEAEAQRQAYAVYQAQYAAQQRQQQQMMQRTPSQRGRGVNIAPLGNSPRGGVQYASASYAYAETTNGTTGVHYAQAIGYATATGSGGSAGIPYAQTMSRGTITASGTYIPAGQTYTPQSTGGAVGRFSATASPARSSGPSSGSGPRSGYDPRDPRARGNYASVGGPQSGRSSGSSAGRRVDSDG